MGMRMLRAEPVLLWAVIGGFLAGCGDGNTERGPFDDDSLATETPSNAGAEGDGGPPAGGSSFDEEPTPLPSDAQNPIPVPPPPADPGTPADPDPILPPSAPTPSVPQPEAPEPDQPLDPSGSGTGGSAGSSGGGGSGGNAGTGGSAGSSGGGGSGGSTGGGSSTGGGAGTGGATPTGPGFSALYPGDFDIDSHPSVLFYEDFEQSSVSALTQRWDDVSRADTLSLTGDVPADARPGSQALDMFVPAGNGITGVTLYQRLPTQQGTVYVRYYAKYDNRSDYHHAGMWLGGYNPSSPWPLGTAGQKPNGSDFFHNALEPFNGTLELDHYAQWPGMGCWRPTPDCYGNDLMNGARPRVGSDQWNCIELMLKVNTPGQSNGEAAVWINDQLIQHLRPGAPLLDKFGNDSWGPSQNGQPFPGFNWRSSQALGLNWIWLDFYVDSGPSSMSWDQVVVANERIGCIAP